MDSNESTSPTEQKQETPRRFSDEDARDGHPLSDAGYNLCVDDVVELLESLSVESGE